MEREATAHSNGHHEDTLETFQRMFSREFFYEDTSIAVQQPAEYMAQAFCSSELIPKAAEITVFLEAEYPDVLIEDSERIAGRIGHTVVAAKNVLRRQANLPPLRLSERNTVIFAYSTALQALTIPELVLQ